MALGLHFFQLSQEGFAGARLFDDTFALRTLCGVPKVLTRLGLHGNIQDSFRLMDALSPNTGTKGFQYLRMARIPTPILLATRGGFTASRDGATAKNHQACCIRP